MSENYPTKYVASFNILKKYGVLIDPKNIPKTPRPLPEKIVGENFCQWKKRVFGTSDIELSVYAPYIPSDNLLMKNIETKSGGEELLNLCREIIRSKELEKKSAIKLAEQETKKKFSTLPKETIQELLCEMDVYIESSTKELFDRIFEEQQQDISIELIIRKLIEHHSKAASLFRSQNKKIEELELRIKKIQIK